MSKTASPHRTGACTEPHRCRGCGRTFWTPTSWNAVVVVCPHCRTEN